MKLSKTRSILLAVMMFLLVSVLGSGLFFMFGVHANADEPEIVFLADAELQATTAYKTRPGTGAGAGVWWDANHTQMRLFYKVVGGTPYRASLGDNKHYNMTDKVKVVQAGRPENTLDGLGVSGAVWFDNMGAHNGDETVGEIWFCHPNWFQGVSEIHILPGFAEKDQQGADTSVVTKKDYYLWNGGDLGWLTRADNTKGLQVSYTGGDLAWGGSIDTSKLEVKATPKGSDTPVKIDPGCYTLEYDSHVSTGSMEVTVKYQDMTGTVSVNVGTTDMSKGLKVLCDYDNAQYRTDWGGQAGSDSQLLIYFDTYGEVTAPAVGTGNLPFTDTTNVLDHILINGQPYSQWNGAFSAGGGAWIGAYDAVTSYDSYNAYVLWLNPGQTAAGWRAAVNTVTITAGFQWYDSNGACPDLLVKENYTIYNAHDAGWQRAADSITATYDGGEVEVGGSLDLSHLKVTATLTDGGTAEIASSKVTVGTLPTDVGAGKVTITYQGKTCECDITMKTSKTLKRIEVTNESYSAQRWTRPSFDDLTVKAFFEGEEEGTVLSRDQYTVSGYDMWTTEGTTTATVTYNYGGAEKTVTFTINVQDNTASEKYFEILDDEAAARNTQFAWDAFGINALSFKINFVGIDLGAYNSGTANYYFDKVKGIHLTDYIELLYDGQTKSATELFTDGVLIHIGISDSGKLIICFANGGDRDKVTQVTFKAGMEFASNQNAFDFGAGQGQIDAAAIFLPEAVLKKDYVFFNGGASGWLKAVETLTASYEGSILQNGELDKAHLTVTAKYYGAAEGTKLADDAYAVEFSSATVGDAIQGTVTYRGKTATFTVKVEAPTKELDRIEVSGTTKFTGKRFGDVPALDGLIVKAYFKNVAEPETLSAGTNGYTVGAMDMWLAEGDHDIEISYTYGETVKTAKITLTIEAPDATKYFDVLEGGSNNGYMEKTVWGEAAEGKGGTRFVWQERFCLSFKINVVGVDNFPKDINGIHFEWVTGIHLTEYVKIDFDGTVKTLKQLLDDNTVKTVGVSDGGNLIICFTNAEDCMKVKSVTFLAGMQFPKVTNQGIAWEWGANEQQVNESIQLVPGLVLQHDVTLYNCDAQGWLSEIPAPVTQYTVTFALGDHAAADAKAPTAKTLNENTVFGLPAAPKAAEGYTFDGWYDGTTKAGDAGAQYTVTKNVTLTAHWKANTPAPADKVTVTFDLNGGTGTAPAAQTIDKNSKATKPADPTREGYTFDGWYTAKDGGTKFDFNSNVSESVKLYAHWTKSEQQGGEQPGGDQPGGEQPGGEQPGENKKGCSSVVGGSALVLALVTVIGAAVIVSRKKEN